MVELERIHSAVRAGDYLYTEHALRRMIERGIRRNEIEEAVLSSEVIEDYPEDKYGPSCLLLGFTRMNRPLHVQVSVRPVRIITVYEPDPGQWIALRRRRSE